MRAIEPIDVFLAIGIIWGIFAIVKTVKEIWNWRDK